MKLHADLKEPEPVITGIDHLVLTVRDVARSVDFYTKALGAQVITFAGTRKALRIGNQKINLQTLGQELRNHACIGSGDICLVTDWPIRRVVSHIRKMGIEILEGPVQKSGALGPITSIYFNDPDGNLIEISSYEKESL